MIKIRILDCDSVSHSLDFVIFEYLLDYLTLYIYLICFESTYFTRSWQEQRWPSG